jgi:hypothetical protein
MDNVDEDLKQILKNFIWITERTFTGNTVENIFISSTNEHHLVEEAIRLGKRLRNRVDASISDSLHLLLDPPSAEESFTNTTE